MNELIWFVCSQLLGDILADDKAAELVFVNDVKVLVDIIVRECTDLPPEDPTRPLYLVVLDRTLAAPVFLQAQRYRRRDVWSLLESLLATDSRSDTRLPPETGSLLQQLLVRHVDLLD